MSVLENMFLGSEWGRFGIMDYDAMYLRCQRMLAQVKLVVDPIHRSVNWALGSNNWSKLQKH